MIDFSPFDNTPSVAKFVFGKWRIVIEFACKNNTVQ